MEDILAKLQALEQKDLHEDEMLKQLLRDLSTLKQRISSLPPSSSRTSSFETFGSNVNANQGSQNVNVNVNQGSQSVDLLQSAEEEEEEAGDRGLEGQGSGSLSGNLSLSGKRKDGVWASGGDPPGTQGVEPRPQRLLGQGEEEKEGERGDEESAGNGEISEQGIVFLEDREFVFLLEGIRHSTGPKERGEILRLHAKEYHWTCQQLCQLTNVIPFPAERVLAVSLISPKILDKHNKITLANHFKFESQQEQARIMKAFEAGSRDALSR